VKYLKIIAIGLLFALFIDLMGVSIGVLRCLMTGIHVSKEILFLEITGIGAKEGVLGGVIVIIILLIGAPRPRKPH
jgi:hypothetical protein